MRLSILYGTRPEIIKASPLIKYCAKNKLDYFTIHTGQHYSPNMDALFFQELRLPQPNYRLGITSTAPYKQGEHTGRMLTDIEEILLKELPSSTLVIGDTNTVLAGSLATTKLTTTKDYTGIDIKLAHVEAGLRSYDQTMPEEINRRITDELSDYLFVPSSLAKKNLLKENIDENKIYVTGNTIVDAIYQNIKLSEKKKDVLKLFGLKKENYILVTAHRQENVDVRQKLENIITGLDLIYKNLKMQIIYPIHPRTQKKLDDFNIKMPNSINLVDPQGYLEFLQLEKNAKIILTDSGGIQEEACILQVPCVTLRENTERQETTHIGSNTLAGTDPDNILDSVKKMVNSRKGWCNPYGKGDSSERIIQILESKL